MKKEYKLVVISFLLFAVAQIMVILLTMFAPTQPSVPYGTLDLFLQIEFVFILCYATGVLILYSRSKNKSHILLTSLLLPAYLILLWYVLILPDAKRLMAVLSLGSLIIISALIQRRKQQ